MLIFSKTVELTRAPSMKEMGFSPLGELFKDSEDKWSRADKDIWDLEVEAKDQQRKLKLLESQKSFFVAQNSVLVSQNQHLADKCAELERDFWKAAEAEVELISRQMEDEAKQLKAIATGKLGGNPNHQFFLLAARRAYAIYQEWVATGKIASGAPTAKVRRALIKELGRVEWIPEDLLTLEADYERSIRMKMTSKEADKRAKWFPEAEIVKLRAEYRAKLSNH